MKKNFTFILLSLLLLVVGGAKSQTTLPLKGGYNWEATDGTNNWSQNDDASYTSGTVHLKDNAWGENNNITKSALGGTHWAATFNTGETHTFTVTLDAESEKDLDLHIVAVNETQNANISQGFTAVATNSINTTSAKTLTLEVTDAYYAVYLYSTSNGSKTKKYKITSITRTVTGAAPSVAAPSISPASGTYDGDLSVTITPGEGNDHVKFTVTGNTDGTTYTNKSITSATTINLTGTSTITVTATGYDDALETNASSTTECEYTYYVPSGKTDIAYGIPHVVNTAMYTYTFDKNDYIAKSGFNGESNPGYDSPHDSYSAPYNLWLHKNDNTGKDYDGQLYILLDKSEWPTGTKAILHFAVKASDGFECREGSKGMQIALQRNSDPYTVCGEFTDGIIPTSDWTVHDLETTVTDAADCEKLFFNCGMFKGDFRFDDIILYKVEEAATGGDNHFTTDDQVANIASSAFSSLKEGDYICANVTGSPETIKLVCNGDNYVLSQFNGGNLWGVKATADMVTALSGNDSEFKGHDLTLNGISIYETTAVTETNTGSITKKNNTFVELTRSFTKDMWNTVCLPFALTAAQADELFGSGYKIAKFTGVSETTMEFTSKDKEAFAFVAGQPYLVKPTEDLSNSSPVVLADVNITAKNGATVTQGEGDYSFTGTFTTKSFAKGDWATTRFVATGNKLNTPNSENAMKALRCYFTVPATVPAAVSPARGYAIDGFMDDDVPTDISATLNDNVQTTKVIYNLAGQRVANPTKGLYIVNGQKVVVK